MTTRRPYQTYRRVAAAEQDEALASVYRRRADVEKRHAEFWAQRLRDAGQPIPAARVGWRTRALGWLAQRLGTAFVVPTIDAMEQADAGSYDAQPEAAESPLAAEERSHARLLRAIGTDQPGGLQGAALARLEGRHCGNSLRAAVLGANDGLVSNFSPVMGVAGAHLDSAQILITGLAHKRCRRCGFVEVGHHRDVDRVGGELGDGGAGTVGRVDGLPIGAELVGEELAQPRVGGCDKGRVLWHVGLHEAVGRAGGRSSSAPRKVTAGTPARAGPSRATPRGRMRAATSPGP